ncbi:transmembrane amino acid transporter protein [Glomus cerebriforme]|uniref:Transmembrane amino acid transporter protein n=1 Tax=Glomus cerebriforme TaxID=658196 RepID=A0A397TCN1_9GLOM|nr:transmembrane amino acid transporter protein [Glomus cerebriforme]
MVSSASTEPVEIKRGKKVGSPSRSGAQEIGNRQNINRLVTSPGPLAQSHSQLSKSQPLSSIQNANDNYLSSSGKFPTANSFGSLNLVPETAAIDIPQQKKAEIVKKHLVTEDDLASSSEQQADSYALYSTSHRLPGGDAAHEVYKWHAEVENAPMKRTRSRSLYLPRPTDPDTSNIREPGGFRRHHVIMKARKAGKEPPIMIRNFIDFLTMYGHFAGEDLSDDEEEDYDEEYEPILLESAPLLPRERPTTEGTATPSKAVFLLLKSFVGTGVMFLPKAFNNGGMAFSCIVLVFIAVISLCSFLLLIRTRSHLNYPYSFGDIGAALYGNWMRLAVLFSITISQIGFVCAYMIFVAENLDSVARQVMGIELPTHIYIAGQLFVYVPLAMIRRISRLSFTALIADAFIMFGLLYLYYYDISHLIQHGTSDIVSFNPDDFALFIGTAVFTFEGIGLIIPITESMKEPEKFPKVLTGVMIFISILFTSIGTLSYATFGSSVKTVVIINLPNGPLVQTIQLLYALAILLSIPLQLFPAIRIMEQGLFEKSGKDDPYVKWQKNIFRFLTVIACALISWGGASDLDKFVSLIGSFACVPLCFIYPPLFHYKVARSLSAQMLDVFILLFGIFSLFYTTHVTIRKWGGEDGE